MRLRSTPQSPRRARCLTDRQRGSDYRIGVTGTASEFLRVIDLAGVFGNAVLGGIVAREQRMDPVGFATLAIMSGLEGGLGLYDRWKSAPAPSHRLLDTVKPYVNRVDCGVCNHDMDCWPHCLIKTPDGKMHGLLDGCGEKETP